MLVNQAFSLCLVCEETGGRVKTVLCSTLDSSQDKQNVTFLTSVKCSGLVPLFCRTQWLGTPQSQRARRKRNDSLFATPWRSWDRIHTVDKNHPLINQGAPRYTQSQDSCQHKLKTTYTIHPFTTILGFTEKVPPLLRSDRYALTLGLQRSLRSLAKIKILNKVEFG